MADHGRQTRMEQMTTDWNRFVAFYAAGKLSKRELDQKRAEIWGPF